MIALYIQEELSYDNFHKNADRTYRVTREFLSPDGSTSLHLANVAPPVGPLMDIDFDQIDNIGRLVFFGGTVSYEDKIFYEDNIALADNDIFNVLTFNFPSRFPSRRCS